MAPPPDQVKMLAKLVHRGLVGQEEARAALSAASGPGPGLVDALATAGVCSAEQWQEWVDTDCGDRPRLSRYELRDALGEGGQARVFAAWDRVERKEVALKILRPELSRDPTAVQAFVAEARLLIELAADLGEDEPGHLVRGDRVAKEGAVIFFAMERVAGQSLQELLAERGRLEEDFAIEAVRQVALALSRLQKRGLVHRDVKPANVLWDPEAERAVLVDLGFAAPGRDGADQGADGAAGVDGTGTAAETSSAVTSGTVHYISPEQARGSGTLDVRADIYSLGATLYHLVCGDLPFDGSDGQEVLAKQVLESLSGRRIRELELSSQLHWLIEKMMAKEKEIRFQDAKELAQAIADVQEQRQRAARARQPEAGPGGIRRRRRRWR